VKKIVTCTERTTCFEPGRDLAITWRERWMKRRVLIVEDDDASAPAPVLSRGFDV
jgi:hypothetical protein